VRARIVSAAAAAAAVGLVAGAAPAMALKLVPVGTFRAPTYVASPRHDLHRLFVTEKFGTVRLVRDGVTLRTPFLQIPGVTAKSEQALASIAFAPDYATSGRFYVDYTAVRPGDPDGSVLTVEEFRRSPADPDRADPASGRVVLAIDHPDHSDHNGGQLQFGRDGLLYVSTGDGGGNELDPQNHAENTHSLLGKILRIDPRATATAPYRIPAGNPFASGNGGAPEVYAYGLRNPWRFSFDAATGALFLSDVGQSVREEIDYAARDRGAGANFGWHCREGTVRTRNLSPRCTPSGSYRPPVLEYPHERGRCAVAGGYVARDHRLGSLYGHYLFGDWCEGRIRAAAISGRRAWRSKKTGLRVLGLDSFGEDACHRLYAVSTRGPVMRIAGRGTPPCS
jgi:glucose/arabinose dehydrogenase